MNKVEERFLCICCQDVVCRPVTTPCHHNLCLTCLQRSFRAEVYNCPCCRYELGKGMKMDVNEALSKALNHIFPGYESGRWMRNAKLWPHLRFFLLGKVAFYILEYITSSPAWIFRLLCGIVLRHQPFHGIQSIHSSRIEREITWHHQSMISH